MKIKKRLALILVLAMLMSMIPMTSANAVTTYEIDGLNGIEVTRLAGTNRYTTAVAIADAVEEKLGSIDTVVIASGAGFADALAAGPLAYALEAPILLSAPNGLTKEVLDKIEEIAPDDVYLIGGTGAVPVLVEEQLKGIGVSASGIHRIAGKDRYSTATAIAEELHTVLGGYKAKVFLTYGLNYPDALSISAIASRRGYPILYAVGNTLPEATASYLAGSGHSDVIAIGGPALISEEVLEKAADLGECTTERTYGSNRYETSAKIAVEYSGVVNKVAVATGINFPDALAGSVYAAATRSAILLVNNNATEPSSVWANRYFLNDYIAVFGGTGVVSDETVKNLFSIPNDTIKELQITNLAPLPIRLEDNGNIVEITRYSFRGKKSARTGNYAGAVEIQATRIKGNDEFMLKIQLYDNDNNKAPIGALLSEKISIAEGESANITIRFRNLPPGLYEVYTFGHLQFE